MKTEVTFLEKALIVLIIAGVSSLLFVGGTRYARRQAKLATPAQKEEVKSIQTPTPARTPLVWHAVSTTTSVSAPATPQVPAIDPEVFEALRQEHFRTDGFCTVNVQSK